MTNDEAMEVAVKEALSGIRKTHGGPFGAVIMKGDEIVAKGHNTVMKGNDPTAHAEVGAIRAACRMLATPLLDGCVLVTTSEPCPVCLGAAYWARVDGIVYCAPRDLAADAGFTDAFIYEDLALPADARRIPVRVDEARIEEVRALFRMWQNDNGFVY